MFGYALKHPIKKANHLVRNDREFTSLTLSCLLGRWGIGECIDGGDGGGAVDDGGEGGGVNDVGGGDDDYGGRW